MHANQSSYLIVGAGAFGSSLALHLIRKYPSAKVTLIDKCDFPSCHGASHDWNKVIRADYANPLYMELALDAVSAWKTDPLYRPYYHRTPVGLMANSKDTMEAINENYKAMGRPDRLRAADPGELKTLWGGACAGANTDGAESVIINDNGGWAEANNALAAVVQAAIDEGVRYHVADVYRVLLDNNGGARGVVSRDGTALFARHVILATGAMTAQILADSTPVDRQMELSDKLVASGFAVCAVHLTAREAAAFKEAPVFMHPLNGVQGGVLPFLKEGKLKFFKSINFTNTVHRKRLGKDITAPIYQSNKTPSKLSPQMEEELWETIRGIFGDKSHGWKLQDGHICWDALTLNKDPVICRHPCVDGLYIMTGGSFHGFKFMPIIGKYAIEMMEGTLESKFAEAWGPVPTAEGRISAYPVAMPSREAKDLGL